MMAMPEVLVPDDFLQRLLQVNTGVGMDEIRPRKSRGPQKFIKNNCLDNFGTLLAKIG